LFLAAIGVGGAGVTAGLGAYRPYLLAGTAAFLGHGFFYTYRKRAETKADACGCERPRAKRAGRIALWIATVIVVLVATAPPLLARWADRARPSRDSIADADLPKATIFVAGIDCEACAAPMRKALAKVGGFHDLDLDIAKQAITVTYEPAPGRLEDYVRAIDGLGYEATLPPATASGLGTRLGAFAGRAGNQSVLLGVHMKLVEVLVFDGCPNVEASVAAAREAIGLANVDADVRVVRVDGDDAAKRLRFLGSPTVRVDGRDVEAGTKDRGDFGLQCRVYSVEGRYQGTPPVDWITAALRADGR
jgi:copper chaperone CopZ